MKSGSKALLHGGNHYKAIASRADHTDVILCSLQCFLTLALNNCRAPSEARDITEAPGHDSDLVTILILGTKVVQESDGRCYDGWIRTVEQPPQPWQGLP